MEDEDEGEDRAVGQLDGDCGVEMWFGEAEDDELALAKLVVLS